MATGSASLIGRAASIIGRRGTVLFGVSLWPFALSFAGLMLLVRTTGSTASDGSLDPIQVWKSMSWLMKSTWILSYISYFFLSPMLALAGISEIVSAEQEGTELSFGSALGRVVRALGRLVALSFAVGMLATLGFQVFVLPGLAVLAITTFAVPAIMLEGKGMRSAWRRSAALVRQSRGAVLALGGGLLLTAILIFFAIFALGLANQEAAKLVSRFCLLLVAPLVAVVFGTLNTLLFLDIKERETAAARAAATGSSM